MTDREQIRQVFEEFEDAGLVSRDIDKVLSHIAKQIIGIGIGEQGFVLSLSDIRKVFEAGLRDEDYAVYSLEYNRMNILVHEGGFANACGEVTVNRMENGILTKSTMLQTLVFTKEDGEWKVCGLHASAPVITDENMEAYPLKVAEKLLRSMRKEIGERAYLAEEQFQRAVLADTIAFYIINFSRNCFERCHINREPCAYVEPGTLYEQFILENTLFYMGPEDKEKFIRKFSLDNIFEAIRRNENEINCEYLMKDSAGTALWTMTVVRLITDCQTGEHKGILYVKDIDRQKRRELEMKNKADCDGMTGLYNKTAFARKVADRLSSPDAVSGVFLILDVDNFKLINDTFGHPFGDRVLVSAAEILKTHFNEDSVLGRLGGDEFGVFLSRMSVPGVVEKAVGELMEGFGRIETPDNTALKISCSIGISSVQDRSTFEQMYEQADKALYRSKQEGKGGYTVFGDGIGK